MRDLFLKSSSSLILYYFVLEFLQWVNLIIKYRIIQIIYNNESINLWHLKKKWTSIIYNGKIIYYIN